MEAFNELMESGGPLMWPLLALSIIACIIATERTLVLAHPKALAHALQIATKASENGLNTDEGLVQAEKYLLRFFPILSTIITGAPMLGILGTVLGIITSFDAIREDDINLALLASGISQALITTAAGLCVALIALAPYNLLRAKAVSILAHVESRMDTNNCGAE